MQRRRLDQPLARVKRLRGHYFVVVKRGPPERGTKAHGITRKPIQDRLRGADCTRCMPRKLLTPSARLLVEICCEQGELVRLLLADGYNVEGTNITPEQVTLADAAGLDRVREGDYRDTIKARTGRLAAVHATDVLEHLAKDEALGAFDHVAAALVPGGVLIARVPKAISPFSGRIRYGDFTYEPWYTARSVRQIAVAAGFGSVTVLPCPPIAHGLVSAARAAVAANQHIAQDRAPTETRVLRGHIVTQNLTLIALKELPNGGSAAKSGCPVHPGPRPDTQGRGAVTSRAAPGRLQGLATTLRRPGVGHRVARTAGFNLASTVAAGLGGVILARVLGPAVRGEYAAITAWFGVALMVGDVGQPAALCFYVARDPQRAREYVATSRVMMLTTGALAIAAGMLLAPFLARGNPMVTVGYRIAFASSIVAFVGASYTSSLQARDLHRWNVVRVSQPALSLILIALLWGLRLLTLDTALAVLASTMLLQLGWAYRCCRRTELVPGRVNAGLFRPLAAYGAASIAGSTPAVLNAQLDKLVLSLTVSTADLGRYAIAVSLTSLPVPLVAAVGYVAFPRLASQRAVSGATHRLQQLAVLGSAALAAGMLVPLALVAYWLVPLVFGAAYRGAVPLLWILTPGAVFLACGQVAGDLLRGRNRPIVVAWAQGLAAIFTVALLFALLPIVGVAGAAIASTVAYGIALAAMLRCLWRLPRGDDGTSLSTPIAPGQIEPES